MNGFRPLPRRRENQFINSCICSLYSKRRDEQLSKLANPYSQGQ